MKEDRFIVGIGQGEHEYTVNGVKYIVDSVFRPFDFKNFKNTLAEAIEATWADRDALTAALKAAPPANGTDRVLELIEEVQKK